MLLGTLGAALLGNLLIGKWVKTKTPGHQVIKAGGILMPPHLITNFEIQKYQI